MNRIRPLTLQVTCEVVSKVWSATANIMRLLQHTLLNGYDTGGPAVLMLSWYSITRPLSFLFHFQFVVGPCM